MEGILLHGLRSVSESKPSEKRGKGLAVWVAYKVNLGETGSCVSRIRLSKFMGRVLAAYLLLLLFHEDAVLKTLCKAFYIALVTV